MITSAWRAKREEIRASARMLQIDRDAFLAAVGAGEYGGVHFTRVIAGARLFNLDYLGAPIHKLLGGHCAGKQASEIQHHNAVKNVHARAFTRTLSE